MRIAAVAVFVLAVAVGCGGSEEQSAPPPPTIAEAPSASAREEAPELSGRSLGGDAFALGDFRGRPVMINVWSSW